MMTLRTVEKLRAELAPGRRAGKTIGLVPTMGALHDGHLSLIRRARAQCDVVVVSLFVNPAQFNERSDLDRYPREERRDAVLAAAAGANVLFAPPVDEIYPSGFATAVEVLGLTDRLEGATRGAAHFRGVTTVVAKLLCMTLPDVAYFGQKDAQQVVVIRRMVADLNLPVRVESCPTVREPDGLAMSSRNALLTAEDRVRALALYEALASVQSSVADGERDPSAATAAGRAILDEAGAELEYLTLVDPLTMAPLDELDRDSLAVVAARLGAVRLIDNLAVPLPHPYTDHVAATPIGARTA
jgi:pantoate--beta-alanine ligase